MLDRLMVQAYDERVVLLALVTLFIGINRIPRVMSR